MANTQQSSLQSATRIRLKTKNTTRLVARQSQHIAMPDLVTAEDDENVDSIDPDSGAVRTNGEPTVVQRRRKSIAITDNTLKLNILPPSGDRLASNM